jgi:hypothetical protein
MAAVTRDTILMDFAQTLTELDEKQVRLVGAALSLQDPRDIANQVEQLARMLTGVLRFGDGSTADGLANAIGAQVVAFRLARARAGELDITAGDAA